MPPTGYTVPDGTTTFFGDGNVAGSFNNSAWPFTSDGAAFLDGEGKDSQSPTQYAKRYTNGRPEMVSRPPSVGAEWERQIIPVLKECRARGIKPPVGILSDGPLDPLQVESDGAWVLREDWVQARVWDFFVPDRGKTPQNPTEAGAFHPSPFRYFVEESPTFKGRKFFYRSLKPTATGISDDWPRDAVPADAGPQPGAEPPVEPPKPGTAEVALASIKSAAKDAAAKRDAIKPPPKGKPAQILDDLLKKIFALTPALLLVAMLPLLVGCTTLKPPATPEPQGSGSIFRRLAAALFTRATMADLQLTGSAGESVDLAVELAGARSPELKAALEFALATGLIERKGPRVLEMTVKDEEAPRWLICRPKLVEECSTLSLHAPIRVYVQPIGLGRYSTWIVHRIVKL